MKKIIRLNYLLWTKYVAVAWELTPIDQKILWLMVASYTISIITILQFLAK